MNFQNVDFIKSVADVKDLPRDKLPHIVFSGRSNVGKSSMINSLLGRKKIARISASPGKTAQINLFLIDKAIYFVDLPGYGYAKVSLSERERWGQLMEDYFSDTTLMSLGILIVDARHNPTKDDIRMADYFRHVNLPFIVAANKIDKLKKSQIGQNMIGISHVLSLTDAEKVIPFSAEKGFGKSEVIGEILDKVE